MTSCDSIQLLPVAHQQMRGPCICYLDWLDEPEPLRFHSLVERGAGKPILINTVLSQDLEEAFLDHARIRREADLLIPALRVCLESRLHPSGVPPLGGIGGRLDRQPTKVGTPIALSKHALNPDLVVRYPGGKIECE